MSNKMQVPKRLLVVMLGLIGILVSSFYASGSEKLNVAELDRYTVVWNSPSDDYNGSMPIGNGDLAANVWIEPNGDLLFYLSKSDAWSSGQELLKLGRVRVRLHKPLVREGGVFKQELDLKTGTIRIQSAVNNQQTEICFWIDANHPVVNVEIKGESAFSAEVMLEPWRIPGAKLYGGAVPDTVLPSEDNTIRWFQRNTSSIFAETLKNQHLGHLVGKYPDPLKNLTFGGLISGAGLKSKDAKTLVTKEPVAKLYLRVHALTARTETPEEWVQQLKKQRVAMESLAYKKTRKKHESYWADFWNNSWLFVSSGQRSAGRTNEAFAVTRATVLQRWIQACAGRGAYPIKFNGSLFTVDYIHRKPDGSLQELGPDARKWGGCYWFQNTRFPYWAMLYSGDYDQMAPLWKMYRDALPLLKERTRSYFNHDGIFCSETMHLWGLNPNHDFGYGNKGLYPTNPYVRYYWDSGNELCLMMLDYYAHTQDKTFVTNTLIPIADEVLKFYDQHHQRTARGKVHFSPAASLETWHSAEDPLPVVVGLKTVLTRLLELSEKQTTPEQRERWTRFRSELPEIPFGEEGGQKWIKPAHVYSDQRNSENPELYAVFPYRAYAVGKPGLEVALETWRRRLVKRTGGWTQDAIQAAMLGLTQEAKDYVVKNATDRAPAGRPVVEPRFPAFWGPNFDWTPDQDHGSVTLIALQRMLMLCDGDTIHLLPAWPDDWDVDFKLHAPRQTTVEGRVKGGKIVDLKVTPESRKQDVKIMNQR
jgi:alpha-L-fucosidase 2